MLPPCCYGEPSTLLCSTFYTPDILARCLSPSVHTARLPDESDAKQILTASPWRTGEDHQNALAPHGWILSRRTWNHLTSPWTKQSTWLRIAELPTLEIDVTFGAKHSQWCMPEMNEWMNEISYDKQCQNTEGISSWSISTFVPAHSQLMFTVCSLLYAIYAIWKYDVISKIWLASIDVYLLEVQSRQISSQTDFKWRRLRT